MNSQSDHRTICQRAVGILHTQRVPLRWYLISLLAPLLILLVAVTILYGLAPLRALAENWSLLFTASCRHWRS
jgi:hypothetical protein